MLEHLLKKSTKKAGLPPGTMVHTGAASAEEPRIHVTCYDEKDVFSEKTQTPQELPTAVAGKVTWINVDGVHRPDIIRDIGERFGIHPLVLEDIVHTGQRPKLEDYDAYTYFTLRVLFQKTSGAEPARESQLSIILMEHVVITFNEFGVDILQPILKRIFTPKGKIRSKKADYLVYTIFDTVVDDYFLILENFGEQIEALEDEVFNQPDRVTLEKLHILKHELSGVRRSIWPLREVINRVLRDDLPFFQESSDKYFRDVYDHTIQIIETIESMRDIASGLFDIYLSSISLRMNQVMKVLTIIATIFIPLTFIAGVYGMNFQYMPELTWKWGYFAVMGLMAVLGAGMAGYFKIKEWF